MINKENEDKEPKLDLTKKQGFHDVARMDVNAHILIKDKDTGEILVNKRG
jgi:hypothetical protein